jgi:colanic acid/amylovoran biosynthesis glycosyltransferase
MKTIAYVINDFPVLSETFIGNEIRAMEKRGHRVVPFVFRRREGQAQPEDIKLAERFIDHGEIPAKRARRVIKTLNSRTLDAIGFVCAQTGLGRGSLLWNAAKMAGEFTARGCDHVHAHFAGGGAAHAITAARLAGLPVSFVCHGHDVYAEPEDLPAKLSASDRVVAVCDDLAADLSRIHPAANIVRIACGTNPDQFTPRPKTEPSNGRLLFVGRLVAQKGIDDLMSALGMLGSHRVPDLDIVGDGPLRDALQEAAKTLMHRTGRTIRFLGGQDEAWLRAHCPSYMAMVLPFKTAPDGSRDTGPLVIKEAMAMGLPVISTTYMGVKETVTPETGVLVPPNAPAALAKAIRTMTRMNDAERRAMGAAGRHRVETLFTLDAQAKQLSQMMEAA